MKLYRIAVGVVGALMLSTAVYANCQTCGGICNFYCNNAYADDEGELNACLDGCQVGCIVACLDD